MEHFQQHLQPLIKELMKNSLGIMNEKSKISEVSSGEPGVERNEAARGDRFKLSFPYGGAQLNWEVFFNAYSPLCPPDFDFNDDAFTNYITVDCLQQTVPSLLNWNVQVCSALSNVISEFVQLFKRYQIDKLKNIPAYSDYENVMDSGIITPDNVEVFVNPSGGISFLFRLPIDMTDFEVQGQDSDYAIHISVFYNRPSAGKMSKPNICMTPALLDVMHTKQFNQKHETTCSESSSLSDYLRRLSYKASSSILQHKVKPITKRKRFIVELLNYLGASILEFDALEFLHASFLLDLEGFSCILHVSLSNGFPMTAPTYTLRSVYNDSEQTVASDRIPFQTAWSYSQIIAKALEVIKIQMNDMKNKPVNI